MDIKVLIVERGEEDTKEEEVVIIEDMEEIMDMDIIKKLNALIVVNMDIKVLIVINLQEKIVTFVESLDILVMIVQKKRNK